MDAIPEVLLRGKRSLLIWHGGHKPEEIQSTVEGLRKRAAKDGDAVKGCVLLEHAERLLLANHSTSSFDAVLSGVVPPSCLSHTDDFLAEMARILKPSGSLVLLEPVATQGLVSGLRSASKLKSALRLAGFVDVSEKQNNSAHFITRNTTITVMCACNDSYLWDRIVRVDMARCELTPVSGELIDSFLLTLVQFGISVSQGNQGNISIAKVQARKPSYEVGASSQLSFASKVQSKPQSRVSAETAKVWTLTASDVLDDEIDIIDPDSLLDDEDLLKPDPLSLKSDCGTSVGGKKKACKNCTCGLAEEISEGVVTSTKPTSSCGSCYLGDAFRCASCPYLGMPAFKPGDQVTLSNRQLNPDK